MSLNSSSSRSSASGSKSRKRILNSMSTASKHSNSSNNTRSSNASSKKKKIDQNQKTLGMAWGSNSVSSSRSVFRHAPFPDFGSYMALKNHKLHQQFSAEAASSSRSDSSSHRPIFEGVSIFVDGYTVPSSQELRGYMLKHGGRFENYFSRHSVTHIICSNLPDSKIKNLRSFSRGLPVIKPTWVLDSVAANKLLSWQPYQLYQLASETDNQPKLSAFFSKKSCKLSNDIAECLVGQEISETGDLSSASSLNEDDNVIGDSESTEHSGEGHSDNLVHESNDGSRNEPTVNHLSNQNRDDVAAEGGSCCGHQSENHANEGSFLVSDNSLGNKRLSNSEGFQPVSTGHSTLLDPNFVENYFKHSRLHFIGTWRNRYRKRFPTLSSGFRCRSSSDNASPMSQKTVIIHIDMDCFFVSVVIRKKPDFKEKAVAVCHSDSTRGTAEISSANYPARAYGVKAGMFVRDAKALCPQLVIFPYDFKAYEEVADQFYDILHKYCDKVQAVSCDEAFLDVTDSGIGDPLHLASSIRKDVLDTTGCTASVGIANNMLMARVATRIAKPDGQCCIPLEKVDDYLCELPVKALPGIGHVLEEKLKRIQVKTCGQLRLISKDSLQKDFGLKTGDMLWNFSRGIDNRLVGMFQESKSVGAEVNWGVRFNDLNDARKFIAALSKEVSLRLQGCGVLGRTFTLKMKKRKSEAGDPVKYMGCGICENLSRSITLPVATDDVDVLQRTTIQLFGYFRIDAKDIRGMGLQASKLERADDFKQGHEKNSIRSWLISSSARARCSDTNSGFSTGEACVTRDLTLPALQDLDLGVIEMLPPEVFSEINSLYGGELTTLISKKREKHVDIVQTLSVPQIVRDRCSINAEGFNCTILSTKAVEIPRSSVIFENLPESNGKGDRQQEKQHLCEGAQLVPVSCEGAPKPDISSPPLELSNLMPLSLSQVDCSVLQQLPEELKADILESLPTHRSSNLASNDISSEFNTHDFVSARPVFINELWVGCPPKWVENFRLSSCRVLNAFAVLFQTSGATSQLSSVLQLCISRIHLLLDLGLNGLDDSVKCLCELIEQYVKFKVETDIEEIYVCFRLLRRLALRSELFLKVYERTMPLLQSAVGESYGGNLNISSME